KAGAKFRVEFPIGHVLFENDVPPGQRLSSPIAGAPRDVRVSPKGDAVAFFNPDPEIVDFALIVVDISGRKRTLSRGWFATQGLAWSPDGKEIWFSALKPGGDPALRAVNLDGRERTMGQLPIWMNVAD